MFAELGGPKGAQPLSNTMLGCQPPSDRDERPEAAEDEGAGVPLASSAHERVAEAAVAVDVADDGAGDEGGDVVVERRWISSTVSSKARTLASVASSRSLI